MNWRPTTNKKPKGKWKWKRPNVMAEVKKGLKGLWRLKWASNWFGAWPIGRERLCRAKRFRRLGENFLRRTNDKGHSTERTRKVRGRGQREHSQCHK
jgi:hypothetical protein